VPQATPPKPVLRAPLAVGTARAHLRHYGILASFVAVVVVPTVTAIFYLFAVADDQYTSTVGFSVRSEDISSALGLLGGLSSLSGTSSSDTDILYQFIQSQELVERVNEKRDLRKIYSKPAFDPYYAFSPDGSIEDLVSYWEGMVNIFYDRGTGLIELRVHAFDPHDAQMVAQEIYDESSLMINQLSAIARADTTRYAKEELDKSIERLKVARTAVTEFRSRTQIVDPTADIQGQMGLLNTLQQQLAAAIIELNLLRETTMVGGDPRINQSERRIAVIQQLIDQEREKFGVGSGGQTATNDYSALVGEFERLSVDREFAEKAYLAALTAYDESLAQAQRQSRYLAAHVRPTLAEEALYPQRVQTSLLVIGLLLAGWGIAMLIYYSVRDRR